MTARILIGRRSNSSFNEVVISGLLPLSGRVVSGPSWRGAAFRGRSQFGERWSLSWKQNHETLRFHSKGFRDFIHNEAERKHGTG